MSLELNLYKSDAKDNLNSSLLGKSNGFGILLEKNNFYDNNKAFWRIGDLDKLTGIIGFEGIMLEDLALNFQTNWGEAGGAVLGKKIASYANSKFLKMLAGQGDKGFQPFICSDAWTQQKMSGDANPVKISLKFKAYNKNKLCCTNYNDIIKFLIHICSPMKSSTGTNDETNIINDVITNIESAIDGAGNLISSIKSGASSFFSENPNQKTIADAINTVNKGYNTVMKNASDGRNNANFTVQFALSNKINGTAQITNKILR